MKIDVATPAEIGHVALLMRESDYREFSAVRFAEGREALAKDLKATYGGNQSVLCAHGDTGPVAIGAALEVRPNVLTLLFFATPSFGSIAFQLTRFIKQRLFPPLVAAGAHRIEAISMVGNDAAHRWIETLGLEAEGPPMAGFGKNREAFQMFAWVSDAARQTGDRG